MRIEIELVSVFRILSFREIREIKETRFPKGSEVIQEWDGFRVSEESENPSFRNVPRLFQEQDEIRVSGFPRKPRFQRVSEVIFGNESSQVTSERCIMVCLHNVMSQLGVEGNIHLVVIENESFFF